MVLSKRRLSPWFLFGLLVVLGFVAFRIVGVFLDYVLVALFLAYLTYPAYPWLRRRLRNRQLAAFVLLIIILGAVLVPLGFIAAELGKELQGVGEAVGEGGLENFTSALRDDLSKRFGREGADPTNDFVFERIQENVEAVVNRLVDNLFAALAEAAIGLFILIYVMYYLYLDGPRFIQFLQEILPMQEAHRDLLFHEIALVVKAVMYGQVLTALMQAIIGGIGFWIFGVPNVVFWAVLMFILALLPIVGPPLVWAPAVVYLWIIQGDQFSAVGLGIYSAILVSTIDNIIRPKLIGSKAHVHPVIVLLGVLGGIAVFGFSGLVLGPLVLSIFATILNVYRKEFGLRGDDEAMPWRV